MDILDENNAAEINKSYKHDTFLAYTKIKSLIEDAYTLLRETKNN